MTFCARNILIKNFCKTNFRNFSKDFHLKMSVPHELRNTFWTSFKGYPDCVNGFK